MKTLRKMNEALNKMQEEIRLSRKLDFLRKKCLNKYPMYKVSDDGICRATPLNGYNTYETIIPKEIFIEAFNRWCK